MLIIVFSILRIYPIFMDFSSFLFVYSLYNFEYIKVRSINVINNFEIFPSFNFPSFLVFYTGR